MKNLNLQETTIFKDLKNTCCKENFWQTLWRSGQVIRKMPRTVLKKDKLEGIRFLTSKNL